MELLSKKQNLGEASSKLRAVERRQRTLKGLETFQKDLEASLLEKGKHLAVLAKTHAAQESR